MACIPPNPRRVGYIDPIHGPLDGPLYMGSHIHQQMVIKKIIVAYPLIFLVSAGSLCYQHSCFHCISYWPWRHSISEAIRCFRLQGLGC